MLNGTPAAIPSIRRDVSSLSSILRGSVAENTRIDGGLADRGRMDPAVNDVSFQFAPAESLGLRKKEGTKRGHCQQPWFKDYRICY